MEAATTPRGREIEAALGLSEPTVRKVGLTELDL